MSAQYYTKLCIATFNKIKDVISKERLIQTYKPVTNSVKAHSIFANLYIRYIIIENELSDIFDQTLQVQKREILKPLLVAVTNRLLEVKKELCKIEKSDFVYFDKILVNYKLTPNDIELKRPQFFPLKRPIEYNELISKLLAEKSELNENHNNSIMTIEKPSYDDKKTESELDLNFLGMSEDIRKTDNLVKNIEYGKEQKRLKRIQFEDDFARICRNAKETIIKTRSHAIKEDISDFVRNWFREMYDAAADFDTYPSIANGGSMAIMKGDTNTPQEFKELLQYGKAVKKFKTKKNENIKMKPKRVNHDEWNFSGEQFITKAFVEIQQIIADYEQDWIFIDELQNRNEKPYMEFIIPDKYAEVHKELHPIVDKSMRVEYETLRKALCKDRKKKYRPSKIKKKRKPKKGKKKRRAAKDMTAGKSIDSLIAELIENDIIWDFPRKTFDNLIGDYNFIAYEMRNIKKKNPLHGIREISGAIRAWVIGMGPLEFEKLKSICLVGPPGSGKKHIVYALAAEVGAVIFNLSTEIVVKYKNQMPYFVNLVKKMARILQPTILFIGGAHKPFIKKATAAQKIEHKLIGKYLPKIVKNIKLNEKILLIGTTNEPWNSMKRKMKKCYHKFVLVPSTNYADKFLIWRIGIQNQLGYEPEFDVSALAKSTIHFSAASILKSIKNVLSASRKMMLGSLPLSHDEFLYELLKNETKPITKKHLDKYAAFCKISKDYKK